MVLGITHPNTTSRVTKRVKRNSTRKSKKNLNVVRAPVVFGYKTASRNSDRIPLTKMNGRNMIVTHRERVDFVAGLSTGIFEAFKYEINPGISPAFPWLNAVANRYEKYKFRKINFIYVPQCATSTNGTVSLVFDFDPNDLPPATMEEAMTYHDFSTGPAWSMQRLIPDLLNGDKLPQKNTRQIGETQTELNNYDLGQLFVCTEGFASAAKLGYLEVEYVVELFIHQIPTTAVGVKAEGPNNKAFNTVTNAYIFGGDNVLTGLNSIYSFPVHEEPGLTGRFVFDKDVEGIADFKILSAGQYHPTAFAVSTNIPAERIVSTTNLGDLVPAQNTSFLEVRYNAKRGEFITPYMSTSGTQAYTCGLSMSELPFYDSQWT